MKTSFLILLLLALTSIEAAQAADTNQLANDKATPSFDDAEAWNIQVEKRIDFETGDRNMFYSFPVFSRDYKRLLYFMAAPDGFFVVICSLEPWDILKRIRVPVVESGTSACGSLVAFSPDEKNVALVLERQDAPMYFINLDTSKTTPVNVNFGKKVAGGATPMLWIDTNFICIFKERLNLDTLQVTDTPGQPSFGFDQFMVSKHKNCFFEVRNNPLEGGQNGNVLVINSRHSAYGKILEEGVAQVYVNDRGTIICSPDLRYLIQRNGLLEAPAFLKLGTRTKPTLDFEVSGLDTNMTDEQRGQLKKAMEERKRIWAYIYGPKRNPLNGRVLGPDVNLLRGEGYLTQIEPVIQFKLTFEKLSAEPENVIAGLFVENSWNLGGEVWGELATIKAGQVGQGSPTAINFNGLDMPITLQETLAKAQAGDAQAQLDLGLAYQTGRGVARDQAQGALWVRKAADQGNAAAQNRLAIIYEHGSGVQTNYAQAMQLYRKAADQGFATAQANLGKMYEVGHGVPRDYAEALNWYSKAASQGNPAGEYRLGLMYQEGNGVEKNYVQAVTWYRKGADQTNAFAEYYLGVMYQNGWGVDRDYAEARSWFQKAADQGNVEAKDTLEKLSDGH